MATPREGRLDLIIGCMFSSKSTEVIHRIRKHRVIGSRLLIINHASDTRYVAGETSCDHFVVSHDREREAAIALESLSGMFDHPDYAAADVIFIEEAQFFSDLYEAVFRAVEVDAKHLVVAGLDGDYKRQPFDTIRLIPLADKVDKLTALCAVCKDGTPGIFSKRLESVDSDDRVVIGGAGTYIPVCRRHMRT